jgi:hypothetical protein
MAKAAPYVVPFLVPLTPVLFHWSKNYPDSRAITALVLVGIALAVSAAVFAGLKFVVPEPNRRSAGASIVLLFLSFYGFFFQHVWKRVSLPRPWMAHVPLAIVLTGIAVAAVLFFRRARWNVPRAMQAVALALGITCALSTINILKQGFRAEDPLAREGSAAARTRKEAPVPMANPAPAAASKPDIYYIILDMYAREDILRKVYNHDNSEFLDGLRRRGFVVADKSCSNYSHTALSLASSLNMTYLDGICHTMADNDRNRTALYSMTQGNRVSRFLKSVGYRYATNLTFFKATESSETADVVYSLRPLWIRGEFIDSLMGTTAGCLFQPSRVDYHRHALESIQDAARLEGPKFVFWHLLLPHNPFVFDRHGNVTQAAYSRMDTDDEGRKQPYVEQLMFVNRKVLEIVDHLQKSSKTPPVILIQGDHGPMTRQPARSSGNQAAWLPSSAERMPILNAYGVPEPVRRRIYPSITPINSFRILLSELFGADLPLLEDRSYFCHYLKLIEMKDVTAEVNPR